MTYIQQIYSKHFRQSLLLLPVSQTCCGLAVKRWYKIPAIESNHEDVRHGYQRAPSTIGPALSLSLSVWWYEVRGCQLLGAAHLPQSLKLLPHTGHPL